MARSSILLLALALSSLYVASAATNSEWMGDPAEQSGSNGLFASSRLAPALHTSLPTTFDCLPVPLAHPPALPPTKPPFTATTTTTNTTATTNATATTNTTKPAALVYTKSYGNFYAGVVATADAATCKQILGEWCGIAAWKANGSEGGQRRGWVGSE